MTGKGPSPFGEIRGNSGCFGCFWKRGNVAKGLRLFSVSNEKNPGLVGLYRGVIIPSYIGIIINHYKDPY